MLTDSRYLLATNRSVSSISRLGLGRCWLVGTLCRTEVVDLTVQRFMTLRYRNLAPNREAEFPKYWWMKLIHVAALGSFEARAALASFRKVFWDCWQQKDLKINNRNWSSENRSAETISISPRGPVLMKPRLFATQFSCRPCF